MCECWQWPGLCQSSVNAVFPLNCKWVCLLCVKCYPHLNICAPCAGPGRCLCIRTSVFSLSSQQTPELFGWTILSVDTFFQQGNLWGLAAKISLSLNVLGHLWALSFKNILLCLSDAFADKNKKSILKTASFNLVLCHVHNLHESKIGYSLWTVSGQSKRHTLSKMSKVWLYKTIFYVMSTLPGFWFIPWLFQWHLQILHTRGSSVWERWAYSSLHCWESGLWVQLDALERACALRMHTNKID